MMWYEDEWVREKILQLFVSMMLAVNSQKLDAVVVVAIVVTLPSSAFFILVECASRNKTENSSSGGSFQFFI